MSKQTRITEIDKALEVAHDEAVVVVQSTENEESAIDKNLATADSLVEKMITDAEEEAKKIIFDAREYANKIIERAKGLGTDGPEESGTAPVQDLQASLLAKVNARNAQRDELHAVIEEKSTE